jgi:hypothetical protein
MHEHSVQRETGESHEGPKILTHQEIEELMSIEDIKRFWKNQNMNPGNQKGQLGGWRARKEDSSDCTKSRHKNSNQGSPGQLT